jgi:hypothetical protein
MRRYHVIIGVEHAIALDFSGVRVHRCNSQILENLGDLVGIPFLAQDLDLSEIHLGVFSGPGE